VATSSRLTVVNDTERNANPVNRLHQGLPRSFDAYRETRQTRCTNARKARMSTKLNLGFASLTPHRGVYGTPTDRGRYTAVNSSTVKLAEVASTSAFKLLGASSEVFFTSASCAWAVTSEGQVALGVTTQGSHRPVRAHIRAYGSSHAGFAIQLIAACPGCYPRSLR
jgi:hypothetical protein